MTACARREFVQRSFGYLSDGREIYLYHDSPREKVVPIVDRRPVSASARASSEFRFDALRGEWVTIAAHRQDRTFLPQRAECPLCPSRDRALTEIPVESYDVAVIENRFPSFAGGHQPLGEGDPFVTAPGAGRCEVIAYTDDHTASFADLTEDRVATVIAAWIDRTNALLARADVRYVFVFENSGIEIGVTLAHPHGQIYAYPFLPPVPARARHAAAAYHAETGSDLYEDIVRKERGEGLRLVLETEHWIAFVPFAARWPIEVHLYPLRRARTLGDLTADEAGELASVYLDLLRRLRALYPTPTPYIAAWHQSPANGPSSLHLELFSIRRAEDKLKYLAGSESAMGAFITDVQPEETAERLRGVSMRKGT